MIRVLTGISIFVVSGSGYALALVLTISVPKIFTAIAFDSGGVALRTDDGNFYFRLHREHVKRLAVVVTDAFWSGSNGSNDTAYHDTDPGCGVISIRSVKEG